MSGQYKPQDIDQGVSMILNALRKLGLEAIALCIEDDYEVEGTTFDPSFLEELADDVARVIVAMVNEEFRKKG
jgi:hypothetical protein